MSVPELDSVTRASFARLEKFLNDNFPLEVDEGELLIDAAIRIMTRQQRALKTAGILRKVFVDDQSA